MTPSHEVLAVSVRWDASYSIELMPETTAELLYVSRTVKLDFSMALLAIVSALTLVETSWQSQVAPSATWMQKPYLMFSFQAEPEPEVEDP